MRFDYELQSLETPHLSLEYFHVPWDTDLMSRQVAQIRCIRVRDAAAALAGFDQFVHWMEQREIAFCTAKAPHKATAESFLLQEREFRFMELNYKPEIRLKPNCFERHGEFEFRAADVADQPELCEMAFRVFRHTRFHLDPLLGEDMGNARYAAWMKNAFEYPQQEVIKCLEGDQIRAFFVQERPAQDKVFWSLVGLAPGLQGRGLAKRIWPSALDWLSRQGVTAVSTSISSLNAAVVNLYANLGFRFPEPEITFHWHRRRKES